MPISEEIQKWSSTVHTDAYSMSFGELMNLYESQELDIHPEFQRFFRWSPLQKTRLIESILLGIPLPSIFVAQREDGVWDVVDGLQRLSTVFELVGILRDEQNEQKPALVLEGTTYLPSLAGFMWDNPNSSKALPMAERLSIKRAKIDVKIIKKLSDKKVRYELFQRLNTGGSQLSDQEVRNCVLISIDSEAYRELRDLAISSSFTKCADLTDRQIDEQYHLELVLRFFLLCSATETEIKGIADLGEFLTDRMVQRAEAKALVTPELKAAFTKTFETLDLALGGEAFRKYATNKGRFEGGFLISGYEAVAMGLGKRFLDNPTSSIEHNDLVEKAKSLWAIQRFLDGIGSGKTASGRMPVSIPVGRTHFGA